MSCEVLAVTWPQKQHLCIGEGAYHLATESDAGADLWFQATCHIDWYSAAVT